MAIIDGFFRRNRATLLSITLILASPTATSAPGPDLNLFITIDTETSSGCGPNGCHPVPIEDRILGLQGGQQYGIGLMMDMLEQHGMKATFFVNAYLDSAYPDDEVRKIVQSIVARGHDVEFHSHEEFRCFKICKAGDSACRRQCSASTSHLVGNTYQNQLAILKEGAENISRWSGEWPVAFRAGAYRADETTLEALKSLHIAIDSSIDGASHELAAVYPINQVTEHNGIIEIPILNFRTLKLGSYTSYRELDLESNTFPEVRSVLDQSRKLGIRTVMTIMHSFSFCRRENGACPHRENIENFANLLDYVASEPRIRVLTLREFAKEYPNEPDKFTGTGAMPVTGYFLTLYRSVLRFNEGWKNRIFAGANLGLALVVLAAFATLAWRYGRSLRRRSSSH